MFGALWLVCFWLLLIACILFVLFNLLCCLVSICVVVCGGFGCGVVGFFVVYVRCLQVSLMCFCVLELYLFSGCVL